MLSSIRLLGRALALSLLSLPVLAQQPTPAPTPPPVLNQAPQPGMAPSAATPGTSVPGEIVGQTYNVELVSGTAFTGGLLASSADELTFQTRDLGQLVIRRASIKQLTLLTPQQARRGYDYQGNGTRLFFAPTARNLRRGEGYVQNIDVFLLGANYGITDNFSVGLLVPVLPGSGLSIFAVTPKASVAINDRFNVGAGVLYVAALGEFSGGIGYGVATYGSADTNFTVGLGYAFGEGEVSNTPVVVLSGAVRVSRRLSLLNETYISLDGGAGGLAGVRIAAFRLSGSLGLLYLSGLNAGFYPAYAEAVYRFGKTR